MIRRKPTSQALIMKIVKYLEKIKKPILAGLDEWREDQEALEMFEDQLDHLNLAIVSLRNFYKSRGDS